MNGLKTVVLGVIFAMVLIVVGGSRDEVLEIHHIGASMCLSCIGLE